MSWSCCCVNGSVADEPWEMLLFLASQARSRNFKQAHWNAYRRLEDVHRLFTEMGMEYYIENGLNCETHSSRSCDI